MPFIGNQPTAVPLSADDLEDNIISTAKIQDNAVTPAKYIEPVPFRNIIINGDMSIAQRGTSESGITSGGYFTVDRFRNGETGLGTWTQSQSTDVPSGQGFSNSLKMDCTTADAAPAAGDFLYVGQLIEGQNLQYLKKGTANAESVTMSFWVKSNKTGTYICELYDNDNTRQISKSYTIDTADTWEKKTITYAGDTTGAFDNDNALSLYCIFWLGAGSSYTSGTLNTDWNSSTTANRVVGQVNLADSTSNEWYITGVQLEAGTTASDFEFLPVDVNLNRCLRYYEVIAKGATNLTIGFGGTYAADTLGFALTYFYKRTTPSLDVVTGTDYYRFYNGANQNMTKIEAAFFTNTRVTAFNNDDISVADNSIGWISTNDANAYLAIDSEL
jgi:hypothetical protein